MPDDAAMGLGLLFPGQGTQHAGMLPWVLHHAAHSPALQAVSAALGPDWSARLDDADWRSRNDVAQVLLTGISLAAWECLAPRLPTPVVMAGYSVGELAASSAAGAMPTEVAVSLAERRAHLMGSAVAGQSTGLWSFTGMAPSALASLCEAHDLAIAIQIGVDRVVLGGRVDALAAAAVQAQLGGAHVSPLAIGVASHTPWMRDAARAFAQAFTLYELNRAQCPLVCNFDAGVHRRPEELRAALAGQIAQTVYWDRCMDAVAERGPRCVLEVGPGTTLARMWQARHPSIPVRSVDEFQSAAAVADWVTRWQ